MRRERSLLADILESADEIRDFTRGLNAETFAGAKLVRSAVVQKLMVIGEAASRLPADFRQRHPEVEWRDIVGLRNILVHAYFQIDWSVIWAAVEQEVPQLREQVARMVAEEF